MDAITARILFVKMVFASLGNDAFTDVVLAFALALLAVLPAVFAFTLALFES